MSETDARVELDFGQNGLIPAVAQDAESGEVLMLAYADREAVERTAETGLAHYYSRSRDELWQKGGTSGHVQRVREVRVDCDGDALLYLVDQEGGACHTGFRSCFYRDLDGIHASDASVGSEDERSESAGDERTEGSRVTSTLVVDVTEVGERVFDPDAVYE